MAVNNIADIFTQETLNTLFPADLSDQFFDALYGDAEEGAYDIRLVFNGLDNGNLNFEFQLDQRPGKCLACNLTYGLPDVFSRHPIINIDQLVQIAERRIMKRVFIKPISVHRIPRGL